MMTQLLIGAIAACAMLRKTAMAIVLTRPNDRQIHRRNAHHRHVARFLLTTVSMHFKSSFVPLIMAISGVLPLAGQITYIDAAPTNISRVDGQPFSPSTSSNAYADSNWSLRTASGLASHGTIYESGGGETVPLIKQRVTGLSAGIYRVYAYFWVASNVNWQFTAGLSATSLVNRSSIQTTSFGAITFNPDSSDHQRVTPADLTNGTFASNQAPTQATGGSDRTLACVDLGLKQVSSTGTLDVYVSNGPSNGNSTNSRTWYDGLGYRSATTAEGLAGIADGTWALGLDNAGLCALSNGFTRGLLWGNGTDKDADNTAVHASLDANLLTPELDPIVLADGESVELF